MVNITQSVAILCDGNNVERSIHSLLNENVMLNFDELIPKLLGARNLNRLIYFREGRHISDKLANRLHEKFYGTVVPCHKSADIPLSIKATQLASKVDTIIILSGDSDYVDLVKHLKSEGVRVEICAVKANTAAILLNEADYFHSITVKDIFRLPANKRRPFQKRVNTNSANYKRDMVASKNKAPVARTTTQPVATQPLVNTVPSNQPKKKHAPVAPKKADSKPVKKAAKKATKKTAKKATKKATKKTAKKANKKTASKSIASKLKNLVSSK